MGRGPCSGRYSASVQPDEVQAAVRAALAALHTRGHLAVPVPDTVVIERPKSRDHGDYATNVALALAKAAQQPPRVIAEALAEELRTRPQFSEVAVAGPGFVNITLATESQGALAAHVVAAGNRYGQTDTMAGRRVNVEFISANPTGPLHLGHTRWAAVGDALARVLRAAGADVSTEFYINDRGVQLDRFGASVRNAAHGQPPPEDGYHGGYILDLAADIIADQPGILDLDDDEQFITFRELAYQRQRLQHQAVLGIFRTHFDVWFSERSLHESGAVDRAITRLREQGHVTEREGAVWLRTTDYGDDKDRVLVKADGEYTYFASDTAYYVDKRDRGFDLAIYLLGADHHGYVSRIKAVAACAGDDMDRNVEVLIGQLVKITRGDVEVKLSKRAGDIVSLDDFVDEVGVDAARYSLIRYPVDSPLTLDLDVITQRTNDNPVFYVQYAHARISSVLRNASDLGIDWQTLGLDAAQLGHPRERELLGVIGEYPRVVASAAELREPHRVARYLEELATAYHRFYDACRVLPRGEESVSAEQVARLWLCAATRQTLANGLDLLGVSAPERM